MPLTWTSNLILQNQENNDPLLDYNTQPSLDLPFANNKTLNDRVSGTNLITFTRNSIGTYVDSAGVIQTAAIDTPRFDHDPSTLESLGLLIEESRTNIMKDSGLTTQMVVNPGVTRTSGGFAAPDGSTDASRVDLPEVAEDNKVIIITEQFAGLQTATDYTASVYLKGVNGGEVVYLTFESVTPQSFVVANLTTEWQRFDILGTTLTGGLFFNVGVDTRTGTGQSYQPEQSFYVWGAQVELGAFPTSYIPTEAATVTRAEDIAVITGTNFSSWHNQDATTVFVEATLQSPASAGQAPIVSVDDGAGSARVISRRAGAGVRNTANVDLIDVTDPTDWDGENKKVAITWAPDDCALATDGVLIDTDTDTGSLTTVNQMWIGDAKVGGYLPVMGGHLKRLTYYPYRLSDTILQEITT